MERVRSPLVSIARASVCRVARPNATATGTRKRRTETATTATGFKRRSGWVTIGAPGSRDAGIIALRPDGMPSVTADTHIRIIEAKHRLARNGKTLHPGCAVYFNSMRLSGHRGRLRCPAGVARGDGPVRLLSDASIAGLRSSRRLDDDGDITLPPTAEAASTTREVGIRVARCGQITDGQYLRLVSCPSEP